MVPEAVNLGTSAWSVECPVCPGGLKRSTQHFISDRRDGVDGDGAKICSRFQCGRERGVVGALAARGVAQGDWASVWQAVVVDLFSGGSAWRHSSSTVAAFTAGTDAERT